MLALRTTIRSGLTFQNCSRCCCKSIKVLQLKNNCPLASTLILSRDVSIQKLEKEADTSNSSSVHRRTFATTSENDVDVNNLERVYYGTLTSRMKSVKIFSLTTSLVGLAAQPILMEQGMKIGGTGMAVFMCSFAGFFTFVTPFLLHFITKKYVTEIHYNPTTEEYIATTMNIILQKVRTKFRASDVKIPEVPGMFTSFNVGKRSLFVDPTMFDDPEHYVRIMGYDKPIDLKLDLKDTNDVTAYDVNKSKKKLFK